MDPKSRKEKKQALKKIATEKAQKQAGKKSGALGWFMFMLKAIGVLAFVAFALSAYVS